MAGERRLNPNELLILWNNIIGDTYRYIAVLKIDQFQQCQEIINEFTQDQVVQAFEECKTNSLLNGKGDGFMAYFGWITKSHNMRRVLMGGFGAGSTGSAGKPHIDHIQKEYDKIKLRRARLKKPNCFECNDLGAIVAHKVNEDTKEPVLYGEFHFKCSCILSKRYGELIPVWTEEHQQVFIKNKYQVYKGGMYERISGNGDSV